MITRATKVTSHHIVQTRQASWKKYKLRSCHGSWTSLRFSKISTRNKSFIRIERTNEMHIHGYSYQNTVKKKTKIFCAVFRWCSLSENDHDNTIIRGRVEGCVRVLAHNGFIHETPRKGKVQNKLQSIFGIKRIRKQCSMIGILKTEMLQAEEALVRMVHGKWVKSSWNNTVTVSNHKGNVNYPEINTFSV